MPAHVRSVLIQTFDRHPDRARELGSHLRGVLWGTAARTSAAHDLGDR